MPSNREIAEVLNDAGRAPIEPVEPRLDALEIRLMASIADDDRPGAGLMVSAGVTDLVARRRARRSQLTLLAGAASIVAVVVLAFTVPGGSDDTLVIAMADDVSVMLPDGSEVAGSDGLELPEGTRLDVMGALRVGDVDFGPGNYVVTADGVVLLVPTTTSSTSTPSASVATPTQTTVPERLRTTTSVPVVADLDPDRSVPDVSQTTTTFDGATRPESTDVDRATPTRPPPSSRPATTPPPTRPATTVPVTRPATTAPVTRSATTVPVTRPSTTVPVTRPPATRPPASTTAPATRPLTTDAPAPRPGTTTDGR